MLCMKEGTVLHLELLSQNIVFDFLVLLFWVSGIVAGDRTDLYVSEAFHKAFLEVSFILSQGMFWSLFFTSMKHKRLSPRGDTEAQCLLVLQMGGEGRRESPPNAA